MSYSSGWSIYVGVLVLMATAARGTSQSARLPIYVGTYTDGESRGIYLMEFDPVAASFSSPRLVAEAKNPTFFAWHPSLPVLFTVSETDTVGPDRSGGLQAYGVGHDGGLTRLNEVPTGGAGACHLTIAADGRHALVANYGGGSVAAFDVLEDGRVQAASEVLRHTGHGPHPTRQTRPHAHAIEVAPGGRFVLAVDLGTDAVLIYRWDATAGRLTPHVPASVNSRPGAGPRHVVFHPHGRLAYVINELDSTLTSYTWDGDAGTLTPVTTRKTLPADWTGENTTAEVVVHPSGRFVYASNRGHDSIAAFATGVDGALSPVGIYPTGGRTPRHFTLDDAGTYLLAANQESDTITAFRVDAETGALSATGAKVQVPSPVFVGFRPRVAAP